MLPAARTVCFALFIGAFTSVPKCVGSEPLYANFSYVVDGDHISVPGTTIELPGPRRCYYYIQDNGYYACVRSQDDEFMDIVMPGGPQERGMSQTSIMGGVIIGSQSYFVYRMDREDGDSPPVLRLGSMFPQGRSGVYVDCISYDADRVYAVKDGVETTYDYRLKVTA